MSQNTALQGSELIVIQHDNTDEAARKGSVRDEEGLRYLDLALTSATGAPCYTRGEAGLITHWIIPSGQTNTFLLLMTGSRQVDRCSVFFLLMLLFCFFFPLFVFFLLFFIFAIFFEQSICWRINSREVSCQSAYLSQAV